METLNRTEHLKRELDSLRPLTIDAEMRIMQKFRLDWNYHSNKIEGNTLTYGETKALILFNITAQGKPLKDHFEITGHNEAINWILDLIKGETQLTEVFIRELHTLLLKENSYKNALTQDGIPTRRMIEVGKYKTQPNHVVTITGETFFFATPEETPAKMQELVKWYRKQSKKTGINPVRLAALFHYRFIRIHPFDDGNGRVARILMNFILMKHGYPPVIVKTEDKENYYAALQLADAGQFEPFVEYIATNLNHSLEIMLRGANGENIEEDDDLDKELTLLEKRIAFSELKTPPKNVQTVSEILDSSILPLIDQFILICSKFERFYFQNKITIASFQNILAEGHKDEIITQLIKVKDVISEVSEFYVLYENRDFKNPLVGSMENKTWLEFKFNEQSYSIRLLSENLATDIIKRFLYNEAISKHEIKEMLGKYAQQHKKYIEESGRKSS